jgi:hypothetical protein
MESARGHYEINVRNTSDHIADFDSGKRIVCVRERVVGRSAFILFSCPCHRGEEVLTRHTSHDPVTKTHVPGERSSSRVD